MGNHFRTIINNHKKTNMLNKKNGKNSLILMLCLLALISCHKTDKSLLKEIPQNWDRLVVDTYQQRIVIGNNVDSEGNNIIGYGVRVYWDLEEIYKETGSRERTTVNYKEEEFPLSQPEKDSLFVWIYDIVTNPVLIDPAKIVHYRLPESSVTVICNIGRTTLSCQYNNTDNWTTISPQLNKVYSLLKSKTKISEN
jgi:hypothetical protein